MKREEQLTPRTRAGKSAPARARDICDRQIGRDARVRVQPACAAAPPRCEQAKWAAIPAEPSRTRPCQEWIRRRSEAKPAESPT